MVAECSHTKEAIMVIQFGSFKLKNGDVVRINPSQVRCIKEQKDGEKIISLIEFDQNHSVIVDAKPEDVERGLTTEDE
jgi:hypothetical protein